MADLNGWTPADYQGLVAVARRIRIPADWLAAVMLNESGLHSSATNSIGCVGLIQWCSPPRSDMASLSPADQMPYVLQYFSGWTPPGGWSSRGQLYQATYVPATIQLKGSSPTTVITQRGDGLYDGNETLDPDGKGWITVGDLDRVLGATVAAHPQKWAAVEAGIQAAGGSLSSSRRLSTAALVFGGLTLGAMGAYVYANRAHLRPALRTLLPI